MALTAIDWNSLLKDELQLTFDILFGLAIGVAVIRSGLADRLMKRLLPHLRHAGVGPVLGMALTVSLGSAKAGAALLASAFDEGRISERTAKWGTLMLSFPAYLHRWPSTLVLAVSLAKIPGAIFAAILLLRGFCCLSLSTSAANMKNCPARPLRRRRRRVRSKWAKSCSRLCLWPGYSMQPPSPSSPGLRAL